MTTFPWVKMGEKNSNFPNRQGNENGFLNFHPITAGRNHSVPNQIEANPHDGLWYLLVDRGLFFGDARPQPRFVSPGVFSEKPQ